MLSLSAAAVEGVRDRMANTTMPRVESPAALFRSALRGRYAESKVKPTRKALSTSGEGVQVAIESKPDQPDPAANLAMAAFEALPLPDQKRVLERFSETLQEPLLSTYAKQGLGSAMIRRTLASWLVKAGY